VKAGNITDELSALAVVLLCSEIAYYKRSPEI